MTNDTSYLYTPLSEPIPLTDQTWPEDTVPLVHVRTMTYNHEHYIRECMEGLLMQKTTFPVLLLIHDDASTDATATILREYQTRYPRLIKVYYQKENSYSNKFGYLRKEFYSWRVGKYEALCEGDDYWTDPLKLQKQVTLLEEDPGLVCVVGGFEQLAFDGSREEQIIRLRPDESPLGYRIRAMDMTKIWITKTLTLVYRVAAKQGYDHKRFAFNRDIHLNVHLLHQGDGYYITQKLGVYRQHSNGIHSGASASEQERVSYACYRELNEVFRTDVTRRLLLRSINGLIQKSRPGIKELGRLCVESIRSTKFPIEFLRLVFSVGIWVVSSRE